MAGGSHWQLPLAIRLNDEATFDNFYVSEANQQLVSFLKSFSQSSSTEQCCYIHGPVSSGRSHLLQAMCHLAQSHSAKVERFTNPSDSKPDSYALGQKHTFLTDRTGTADR